VEGFLRGQPCHTSTRNLQLTICQSIPVHAHNWPDSLFRGCAPHQLPAVRPDLTYAQAKRRGFVAIGGPKSPPPPNNSPHTEDGYWEPGPMQEFLPAGSTTWVWPDTFHSLDYPGHEWLWAKYWLPVKAAAGCPVSNQSICRKLRTGHLYHETNWCRKTIFLFQ